MNKNKELFYKELDLICEMEAFTIFKQHSKFQLKNDTYKVLDTNKQAIINSKYDNLVLKLNNNTITEIEIKELMLISILSQESYIDKVLLKSEVIEVMNKLIDVSYNMRIFKYALVFVIAVTFNMDSLTAKVDSTINKLLDFNYDDNGVDNIKELVDLLDGEDLESFKIRIWQLRINRKLNHEIYMYTLFPEDGCNVYTLDCLEPSNKDLIDYNNLVQPIMLDELKLLADCLFNAHNKTHFSSLFLTNVSFVFKLGNTSNKIGEGDYEILANMLERSKLLEYKAYIHYEVPEDVYDNFKKLCTAYVKLIANNLAISQSSLANRVNKILVPDTLFIKDNKINKYYFGEILRTELVKYEDSVKLNRLIVERML